MKEEEVCEEFQQNGRIGKVIVAEQLIEFIWREEQIKI